MVETDQRGGNSTHVHQQLPSASLLVLADRPAADKCASFVWRDHSGAALSCVAAATAGAALLAAPSER